MQDEINLNKWEQLRFSKVVIELLNGLNPKIAILRKGDKNINSTLLEDYSQQMVKIKALCFGAHLQNVLCIRVKPIIKRMNSLIEADKTLEMQRNELTEESLKKADKQCNQINLKIAESVQQILDDIALLETDLELIIRYFLINIEEGRFNLDKKDGRFLSGFLKLMKDREIDRSLDSYYIPMLGTMIGYLTDGIEFRELILGLLMMKIVIIEMISYMKII